MLELAEDAPVPEPGEQDVLVRVTRAGVNFADTHARENSYLAALRAAARARAPRSPAWSSATATASRPASASSRSSARGGYAEYAAAPGGDRRSRSPTGVSDATALALLLQGLTAWHLLPHLARGSQPGESVVVHAAAGGVGSLAVQLGKPLGAGRVIATASTEEKRALALELGADVAVDVTRERPRRRRSSRPTSASASTSCSRWRAAGCSTRASTRSRRSGGSSRYGIASREPNQVATGALMRKSRAVIGFWLMHCLRRPAEMVDAPLQELFERAAAGELRVVEGETYGAVGGRGAPTRTSRRAAPPAS